jgi:hypothetical protein
LLDEFLRFWFVRKRRSFADKMRHEPFWLWVRAQPQPGRNAACGILGEGLACGQEMGCAVFSLSYVLIMAGLAFGGSMALIGFGGLLVTSFHRALGSPLPLPTLHNASERRLYVMVGIAGLMVWASAFLCSLNVTPW